MKMQVEDRTFWKRIDLNFILVILTINLVGLINLYSATHIAHSKQINSIFVSQIFWLLGGWIVFFVVTFIDYRFIVRFAWLFFALNLLALLAVPVIGKSFYGAKRWLDLGFFRYQPSETMKLALIILYSKLLMNLNSEGGLGLKELLIPILPGLVVFLLVAKQPDLGTGMLLIAITASLFLFIGVKRRILIVCVTAVAITFPLAWNFALKDYQKARVLIFLSPGSDPQGAGYNSIQSKIAVGSGKILGKGFRKGTQAQLEFLPERHTDFIFSVLSEEHGFVGSMTTVALFTVLLLMAIKISSLARDRAGAILTVGVVAYLFWHVFVNISMVTGILPIVGVPLPLLSYGGSSLLTTMVGLGLISSVSFRKYLF